MAERRRSAGTGSRKARGSAASASTVAAAAAPRPVVHATALRWGPVCVLLRGRSGAGKSDLALRCLALPAGPLVAERFGLIADDQVQLEVREGCVVASCPAPLVGLIEVRGIGIVPVPAADAAPIRLVVDLVEATAEPRMPDEGVTTELLGHRLPLLRLDPRPASAPLKLALAAAQAVVAGSVLVQPVAN